MGCATGVKVVLDHGRSNPLEKISMKFLGWQGAEVQVLKAVRVKTFWECRCGTVRYLVYRWYSTCTRVRYER